MPLLIILLFVIFPSLLFAQVPMKIKVANFENSETYTLAVYEGGNVWLNNNRDKLYYDNGKELVIYKLEGKTIGEISKNNFDTTDLKNVDKYSASKILKRIWAFTLEDKVSSYSIDGKSENFFLADNTGYLFFYDIRNKDFKGKLKFSSKPIKIVKVLNNGNLILINQECEIIFVERVKIPFFSFLQDLRSFYKVSKVMKLEANFVSRVIFDKKQELMAVIADHKNTFIIKLPTLEIVKKFSEGGYIRFAEFLDGKTILYSVTTAFSKVMDNPFNLEAHMATLAHFFDRTGITIPSYSGSFLLRFENRKELRLYNVEPLKLMVDLGDLIEKGVEVTLSPDDRTLIFFQEDKNRFVFYHFQ